MHFALPSLFQHRAQPLAGVSFGAQHLRWVELDGSARGPWVLRHLAQERYAAGILRDGLHIQDMNALASALQRLTLKSGSRTRRVALCLPASAMMTRRVLLHWSQDEAVMREQVEQVTAQHIPYALDEIALDWSAIGQAQEGRLVEVLICAAKRDTVEDFQILCELSGLEPVVLADESQAVAHVVEMARRHRRAFDAQAVLAHVQLDTQAASHLYFIQRGLPLQHVSLHAGALGLLENIASRYGCSIEEAHAMQSGGSLPLLLDNELIPPFVKQLSAHLAQELRHSAQRYDLHLTGVYVGGGGANLSNLTTQMAAHLALPCELLDPFASVGISAELQRVKTDWSSMALDCVTATGLALRRFDGRVS
jgi:type IV pilus assembly protein PilM